MIIIHPSRYIFQHCPEEDIMWEKLVETLSTSGFESFIQKVCWFHQLEPIDSLIVEFVVNFRGHEGVTSVQGHVISVKENDIANATGLPPEGLEVGFWDDHMKKLEVDVGIKLRCSSWCPDRLASVGIVGKRASLQFSVGDQDKIRRYLLALVMQHFSGVNSTTCSVRDYLDSVDGLLGGVYTNWPRHISQRMALVFPRLQKGECTFVPYASVIAMLLLHQAPGVLQGKETVSGCPVQEEEESNVIGNPLKVVGNACTGPLEVVRNVCWVPHSKVVGIAYAGPSKVVVNACWNEVQKSLKDVKIEAGNQTACWDEAQRTLRNNKFEAGGIEKVKRFEFEKHGEGLISKKPNGVLAVQTPEITQRCLRESPPRKLCCVQCPPLKESFNKRRMSGEIVSEDQVGEQSQTPFRQSKREEYEAQLDYAVRSECRNRAQSATQKRKSRSITELLVDKRHKPMPSENRLQEIMIKGIEVSSSGTKAYNSFARSSEMNHIQPANLEVVDGHKQRDDQEPLLRAKAKLEILENKLSEYLLKMKESFELHKQKDKQLKGMEVQFIITKAELNSKVEENNRILKELEETKLALIQKETAWDVFNEKISAIKEELKHLIKEKNIQSVEAALHAQNYHKQKDDQIKGLQAQLIQAKAEMKSLIDEKNLLSEQLEKTKESLDFHKQMADRLEDLEVEMMLKKHKIKSLSDENKRLSNELKETKDDLNRKEVAWKKSNEKLVNSVKCIVENDVSAQTTLEQATDFEQKPKYITFLEDSFNTLKQQIDNLMDKCVKSFVSGETTKEDCDNDLAFICSICMEPWTSNGDHQICSLACGHYFGKSCIRKWLEQSRVISSRKCPLCFKKVKMRDIRRHYVQQIAVACGDSTDKSLL